MSPVHGPHPAALPPSRSPQADVTPAPPCAGSHSARTRRLQPAERRLASQALCAGSGRQSSELRPENAKMKRQKPHRGRPTAGPFGAPGAPAALPSPGLA